MIIAQILIEQRRKILAFSRGLSTVVLKKICTEFDSMTFVSVHDSQDWICRITDLVDDTSSANLFAKNLFASDPESRGLSETSEKFHKLSDGLQDICPFDLISYR